MLYIAIEDFFKLRGIYHEEPYPDDTIKLAE